MLPLPSEFIFHRYCKPLQNLSKKEPFSPGWLLGFSFCCCCCLLFVCLFSVLLKLASICFCCLQPKDSNSRNDHQKGMIRQPRSICLKEGLEKVTSSLCLGQVTPSRAQSLSRALWSRRADCSASLLRKAPCLSQ